MTRQGICILILAFLAQACEKDQKNQVPESVRQTFQESYANAQNVEWSLKENSYEVDFYVGDKQIEAEFDLEGKQVQEESFIDINELPQPIKDYLRAHFPQYHIGEASIEEKGGIKVYELELLNGFFREVELEFDLDGNLLSEETFKE